MYELLTRRRSIRKFQERAIEKSLLDGILKAALLSPSSRNLRPWRFVVVDDLSLIVGLSRSKQHGSEFLETAKAAVVVTADPAVCDVWVEDTAVASSVLLFAAEAAGLGACWCQIRLRPHDAKTSAEDYVRGLLGIPDTIAVASVIGLGYPEERIPPYKEGDLLLEKLLYNGFQTMYRLDGNT